MILFSSIYVVVKTSISSLWAGEIIQWIDHLTACPDSIPDTPYGIPSTNRNDLNKDLGVCPENGEVWLPKSK